ncbi:MAG: rhomboid family intramembrane serine protease [Kastovskya adunca ATA6-11-RM4]|jgi:membrane associated rhomboid family serine protease|nr:rhomboid family intramembrane serine protease [Kastovskya adunca ATA6-11-RM4]
MIPIADNLRSRRTPIVNYLLIGFTVALFFWEVKLSMAGELGKFLYSWGVVPVRLSSVFSDAFTAGNFATWVALLLKVFSLPVALFLHASFAQILGNLLFLWVFGKSVEGLLGHGRYLGFYLLGGILTEMVQVWVDPTLTTPLVGANGAIAALLGAYFFSFPKAKIEAVLPLLVAFIPIELPTIFFFFWWFVQQLFYEIGQLPGAAEANSGVVAYWTHGLGLLIGAALVLLMAPQKQ